MGVYRRQFWDIGWIYKSKQSLGIRVGRGDFTTFRVNSILNHFYLEVGLVCKKYANSRCLFVEWKMIERKKGENHDKVNDKTLGQLVVVKEQKGAGWRQGGEDNINKHERRGGKKKEGGKTKEVGGKKTRGLCFFYLV
jgi:hypothetical protein